MPIWICEACALEHPDTAEPPGICVICTDERQFVPPAGQRWTTSERLERAGTTARIVPVEAGLHRMTVAPRVGIGQQAFLVTTPAGNLLWEPPGFISASAVGAVRALGGVAAVAGSHPHLMGAAISWSHAFGDAPVYVAADDSAWSRRPDPVIRPWVGLESPLPGVTLVQCGGHFPGSCVLLWREGAEGRGVLLTGDTIFIGPDNKTVSAMRSYPNLIPLPEQAVRIILDRLHPLAYDRMYGPFGQVVASGARAVVTRSLTRLIAWLRADIPDFAPSPSPSPSSASPSAEP
ncbi:MBL fold metallo-hydrolase [Cryobacterium tagatosivorans]|uniref:MBL fold metallo-hydrolase n=1 Tax=Cryobacterium tagatosivorans TaxID=1259199 RepID=A0A4R8UJP7_9MICO|nr:MBL fold metallo-hydrolase [Cryobacterium tagatosivorans]TFB56066.1 MBL fold metallo-hydrolase [Cryobacterium tagatosivorans]